MDSKAYFKMQEERDLAMLKLDETKENTTNGAASLAGDDKKGIDKAKRKIAEKSIEKESSEEDEDDNSEDESEGSEEEEGVEIDFPR